MPSKPDNRYQTLYQNVRLGTPLRFMERRTARAIIRRVISRQRQWVISEIYPVVYVMG